MGPSRRVSLVSKESSHRKSQDRKTVVSTLIPHNKVKNVRPKIKCRQEYLSYKDITRLKEKLMLKPNTSNSNTRNGFQHWSQGYGSTPPWPRMRQQPQDSPRKRRNKLSFNKTTHQHHSRFFLICSVFCGFS